MKIFEMGNTLRVLPSNKIEERHLKQRLMGWRQKPGDPYLKVEDCYINRLVLELPLQIGIGYGYTTQLSDKLKDYQVGDVIKMCGTPHVLNANPMGLGKTVEAIEYLRAINAQSVLIVVPKIIMDQWARQIKKWWGRDAIVIGSKTPTIERGNIYIINYDKLRNDKVLIKFKSFTWDCLILDEAHRIKNRTSKQTIAVKTIPSMRRVALTGTPILRYVDDLWSILNFLGPKYSGSSYWAFVDYFCQIEETPWGRKVVGTTTNEERQRLLQHFLELFMIRHNAIEVAKGKTVDVVRVPMDKAQRNLYRQEKQLLLDQLPENCTISNGAVLTMRLRQTTSWPGLFVEGLHGPKFEWMLETCEGAPDESFVVFTVFEKTAEALRAYLDAHKIKAVTITGKNSDRVNQTNKQLFGIGEAQVLIGTIGSMGQGYDDLQYVSRICVFFERDWSPEINAQAEDRLHRMGQQHPVHVIYLECQGSIDQHVGRINMSKAEGIRQALNSEEE